MTKAQNWAIAHLLYFSAPAGKTLKTSVLRSYRMITFIVTEVPSDDIASITDRRVRTTAINKSNAKSKTNSMTTERITISVNNVSVVVKWIRSH